MKINEMNNLLKQYKALSKEDKKEFLQIIMPDICEILCGGGNSSMWKDMMKSCSSIMTED